MGSDEGVLKHFQTPCQGGVVSASAFIYFSLLCRARVRGICTEAHVCHMCVICVNSCQPQESLLRRYLSWIFCFCFLFFVFLAGVSHVVLEFNDLDRLAGHERQGPSRTGITRVPHTPPF